MIEGTVVKSRKFLGFSTSQTRPAAMLPIPALGAFKVEFLELEDPGETLSLQGLIRFMVWQVGDHFPSTDAMAAVARVKSDSGLDPQRARAETKTDSEIEQN